MFFFFFSSRRRHTRSLRDWSSDVCSSDLEAITTLAASGDWRAVHLRLTNQVRPLEYLASALVEKVEHAASEQQAETVLNIRRVRRLVFWVVPVTAIFTLLIAATLGLAIT